MSAHIRTFLKESTFKDLFSSLSLIILLIPTSYVLYSVCRAISSLRDIPGPFLARFTRLWKLQEIRKGAFEKTNRELHKKYGPIVRIAPTEYSIDDPEAVKVIYGLGSHFEKSPWYIASGNPDPHATPDLFTDRNGARHAISRRKVASAYSMSSLTNLEPFVDECTAILTEKFSTFAEKREVFNLAHWMQCYAFDVIGKITLAERFGFMDNGEDIGGIMDAIAQYLRYAATVGVYSEFHWYASKMLKAISKLSELFGGQARGDLGSMMRFTLTQLEKIQSTPQKGSEQHGRGIAGQDFLSKLLRMHQEDPSKVGMDVVFNTCLTNIGAGSDTTSISLNSVLYHLCKYPLAVRKLRDEIDTMASQNLISDPVTFAQTQKMVYLQAVLKEALRMHPATGLPLGRVVPKGGALIAGRHFPAGTIVGVNSWVAHANEDVFGPDALVFRPERWLGSKEETAKMERYFFTFGMGSRTCIGKNISLLEMAKVIPQLVRNFDFELVNADQEWQTENDWFVKQKNLYCRVKSREAQA